MSSTTTKTIFRLLWFCAFLCCTALYLFNREHLTAGAIFEWVSTHSKLMLVSYSALCILRGITLIPSTPFIFAGIMILPDNPLLLLGITLGCILLSSLIIYYLSGYLGPGSYLEKAHHAKIMKLREQISRNSGFYVIAIWAVLPFTPTDLMVYAAGSMKLPFKKVLLPLMLGETIICAVYIFGGSELLQYFS